MDSHSASVLVEPFSNSRQLIYHASRHTTAQKAGKSVEEDVSAGELLKATFGPDYASSTAMPATFLGTYLETWKPV